jgi:hypothetical protein
MTRQEFVDLIRFLSELGKPGPYARKTTTTVQRWKVLTVPPEELNSPAPDNQVIQTLLNAPAGSWNSAYARFDGTLPLEPVLKNIKENPSVIYLQGEVEVTGRGQTRISLGNASGVTAWINDQPIKLVSENPSAQKPGQFLIPIGRQKLTFRVDLSKHRAEIFRAEFLPVEFGQAILTVIGGK